MPPTTSQEPPFTSSVDTFSISVHVPMPLPPFLTLPEVKKVVSVIQLVESTLSQRNISVIKEKDAFIGFGMSTFTPILNCDLALKPCRLS